MSSHPQTFSGALRFSQLLLVTAIGLAGYLAFQALTGSQVAGCGPEEGCGKVLSSKWASILSVPISIPGLITYAVLLALTQFKSLREKSGGFLATVCALAILLSALWFTALQMFVIKSYCAYCCTTHFIAALASLLILAHIFEWGKVRAVPDDKEVTLPKRNTGSKKQRAKLAKKGKSKEQNRGGEAELSNTTPLVSCSRQIGFFPAALVSLAIVGVTILLQSLGPEKDRSEILSVEVVDEKGKAVIASEEVLISPFKVSAHSPLYLAYYGGTHYLEQKTVPVVTLGKAVDGKEPILLTYLFDWTCDHCRALHERLHKLSLEDSPLGLKDQYKITYLPGAYTTESETLHRVMLVANYTNEVAYKVAEQSLYDGSVQPNHAEALNSIWSVTEKEKWPEHVSASSRKVKRALEVATAQAAHNEEKLGVTIFPQLTSVNSVLSGVPTDKSLKLFLENAAQEQRDYLMRPERKERATLLPHRGTIKAKPDAQRVQSSKRAVVKPPVRNKSVIEFTSLEVKASTVPGGIASGTFYFKNTGTEPLTIYNLKTGCGCTFSDSTEWKKPVPAGASGEFTVKYNSKGKPAYGTHNRHIWVTSSASNFENVTYGTQVKLKVSMLNEEGGLLIKKRDGSISVKKEEPIVPVPATKPALIKP